jgi:hypothetical protein
MTEPARPFASVPALTFEGGLGEFVERFCDATAGRGPELVAVAVWRLRFDTDGAAAVRHRAAQLVRNHAHRLGMDRYACDVLVQAIEEIGIGVTE